ncbi:MAG: electron transfer flavoprotein subunit alpha/FixB family protein [Alphaproteobacteria bacterium]|nr:electron transfer flavoprotein subunit alpha/FixB family protein [Alphaproteobacteria bacterium]TAD90984.1 MAG: electron transfer flavoprotein subunit alpha/FixB family protein [Alphaproteobacteria bacterium]
MSNEAPRSAAKKQLPEHFKAYTGVWVYIELERGQVHSVSWELLGEGRKLADQLKVPLAAVVLGPPDGSARAAVADSFCYGADRAYLMESALLADYRNEPYTRAMTDLVNTHKPEVLLLGATTLGRDLAGSVATTLKTGLTADCTELAIDAERSLAATRPTFGGSLLCTIMTLNVRPQMATIRPRVMAMPQRVDAPVGEVVEVPFDMAEDTIITKVIDFIADSSRDKVQLAYADIVVAGGLGLGNADNLRHVRELARVLGGEWGCSRPLVQKGWAPADRQIGQTGKTIRPKLYIAAGISGAIQHRVGVEGADLILAINTDKAAPILDFAHYALIADAAVALPALTTAFARRLGPAVRLAG